MILKLATDKQITKNRNQKTSLAEVPKAMCTQAKSLKGRVKRKDQMKEVKLTKVIAYAVLQKKGQKKKSIRLLVFRHI